MPTGKPGSGEQHTARKFVVTKVRPDLVKAGRWWAVCQGARWRFCTDLTIQVTTCSVEIAGVGACLTGVGVVRTLKRGAIVVTA